MATTPCVTIVPFEPPIFDPDDTDGYCTYLKEYGFVVIQALTEDEVAEAEEQFWTEALG